MVDGLGASGRSDFVFWGFECSRPCYDLELRHSSSLMASGVSRFRWRGAIQL